MLKLFLRVCLAFTAIVGLVLLIGCFIPRSYDVQTSIVIEAPPEKIFPLINRLSNWESWSMLSESRIEGLDIEYSGEEAGSGAIQSWTEPRGKGRMSITASEANKSVDYAWRFDSFPKLDGRFTLKSVSESPQKCEVTWSSSGQLPAGPFYGYFSFVFESAFENEYQKSLQRLKTEAEK